MSATVVPFPRTRDRAFVQRHAARMADLSQTTAEKHLAAQLDVQRTTMTRRGIEPELIEKHLQALECAIRCELWRTVLPGDTA
jgi:hypothetical protein